MEKNVFIFIIVVTCCCCCTCAAALDSSSLFSLRKLLNLQQVAPAGSPVNLSDSTPLVEVNSEKPPPPLPPNSNSNSNNHTQVVLVVEESPLPDNKNKTPPHESNTAAEQHKDTSSNNISTCQGPSICSHKHITACILPSKHGSNELLLMVLNGGETTLKVNVSLPNQFENPILVLDVPKHEMKRVRTESITVGKSSELIVSSGSGKCVIPLVRPVSVENFIQQVSFYSRQVTPIYGAYTLFVLVLLFGGTWACCKFRKKNRHDGNGIPYQEIEMGLPDSTTAANVDATEGWDEEWDNDDWDDEETVRAPGAGGHISKNRLTSRSSKTGGWENEWDD